MYSPEEWHGYFWQGHKPWSRNLDHTPLPGTRTKNFNANCLWWRNGHQMFASLMISILIMLCWCVRTVSYSLFVAYLNDLPQCEIQSPPIRRWHRDSFGPRLIAINNITARSPQSQWKMVIRLRASSHERGWPGWRWEKVKNTGDEFWRQNRETK